MLLQKDKIIVDVEFKEVGSEYLVGNLFINFYLQLNGSLKTTNIRLELMTLKTYNENAKEKDKLIDDGIGSLAVYNRGGLYTMKDLLIDFGYINNQEFQEMKNKLKKYIINNIDIVNRD